jgi:hypothetical protein
VDHPYGKAYRRPLFHRCLTTDVVYHVQEASVEMSTVYLQMHALYSKSCIKPNYITHPERSTSILTLFHYDRKG